MDTKNEHFPKIKNTVSVQSRISFFDHENYQKHRVCTVTNFRILKSDFAFFTPAGPLQNHGFADVDFAFSRPPASARPSRDCNAEYMGSWYGRSMHSVCGRVRERVHVQIFIEMGKSFSFIPRSRWEGFQKIKLPAHTLHGPPCQGSDLR